MIENPFTSQASNLYECMKRLPSLPLESNLDMRHVSETLPNCQSYWSHSCWAWWFHNSFCFSYESGNPPFSAKEKPSLKSYLFCFMLTVAYHCYTSLFLQLLLLKSTDGSDVDWSKEVKGNMYDMVVEGFQLLSRWTARIWEQCAWKFSRPCKDASPSFSDYEKVRNDQIFYYLVLFFSLFL